MGCVYFYKQNNSEPIKIGMTNGDTPENRIKSLLTGAPYGGELIFYFYTETPRKDEKEIHEIFKKDRIYKSEWFYISIEEVFRIGKLYRKMRPSKEWLKKIDESKK